MRRTKYSKKQKTQINQQSMLNTLAEANEPAKLPNKRSVGALRKMRKRLKQNQEVFEVDYYRDGHPRNITTSHKKGLLKVMFKGDFAEHARTMLNDPDLRTALFLKEVELDKDVVIDHNQTLDIVSVRFSQRQSCLINEEPSNLEVNGGAVVVYMNNKGKVRSVSSTLRFGKRPNNIENIITEDSACKIARKHLHAQQIRTAQTNVAEAQANQVVIAIGKALEGTAQQAFSIELTDELLELIAPARNTWAPRLNAEERSKELAHNMPEPLQIAARDTTMEMAKSMLLPAVQEIINLDEASIKALQTAIAKAEETGEISLARMELYRTMRKAALKACLEAMASGKSVEEAQIVAGKYIEAVIVSAKNVLAITMPLANPAELEQAQQTIAKVILDSVNNTDVEAAAKVSAEVEVENIENLHIDEVKLVLSAHAGQMNPVYRIKATASGAIEEHMYFLIDAKKGLVVHEVPKLFNANDETIKALAQNLADKAVKELSGTEINGKVFPTEPSRGRKMFEEVIVQDLQRFLSEANPKILKNHRCRVLYDKTGKGQFTELAAKSDGSYLFDILSPEFSAVVAFWSYNKAAEICEAAGFKPSRRAIDVYVDDKKVRDNAYFHPSQYVIRLGWGSGPLQGGLENHICYSDDCTKHEAGHQDVMDGTPGKDFPGAPEGSALHEMFGDSRSMAISLVMLARYGKHILGRDCTWEDLKNFNGRVGEYLVEGGIRDLKKSNAQYPQDIENEEHHDSLIVGGAAFKFLMKLVELCQKQNTSLEEPSMIFLRIWYGALALVPAHKVTFQDWLRAIVTAAQALFDKGTHKSNYRDELEACFKAHGVVLPSKVVPMKQKAKAAKGKAA